MTQVERLTALETKIPDLEKRIDKQEELMQEIHSQGKTLATQTEQIKILCDCYKKQNERLDEIEKKPSKRWDLLIASGIAAVVSFLVLQITDKL